MKEKLLFIIIVISITLICGCESQTQKNLKMSKGVITYAYACAEAGMTEDECFISLQLEVIKYI